MVADEIKAMLDAPLAAGRVATRNAGRGRMVPYLEGWDLIACANAIFGYDGWSYEVISTEVLRSWTVARVNQQTGETYDVLVTLYQSRVRVEALGAVRIDVGSSVTSEDTPEAHDTALKGAATDALKRALRTFGTQFGNDLYDKNGPQEASQPASGTRPTAQPPMATATEATQNPDGFRNVGDLLTAALKQHGLDRTQVQRILNITDPRTVIDLPGAWRAIMAHVNAQTAEPAGGR